MMFLSNVVICPLCYNSGIFTSYPYVHYNIFLSRNSSASYFMSSMFIPLILPNQVRLIFLVIFVYSTSTFLCSNLSSCFIVLIQYCLLYHRPFQHIVASFIIPDCFLIYLLIPISASATSFKKPSICLQSIFMSCIF